MDLGQILHETLVVVTCAAEHLHESTQMNLVLVNASDEEKATQMVALTIGAKVVATVDYILQDFAKVAVADYELQLYVMEHWNTVEENEVGSYFDVEMADEMMKEYDG